MSKEEKKLKAKVDEYFEKYWSVSFDKFLENWEEMEEWLKHYEKEIEKLKVIVQVVLQKKNLEKLDIDKLYEVALKLKEEQMIEWKW